MNAWTRDDVWRVVAAHDPGDDEVALCRVNRLTDTVWPLVSGDDPAVHVVRESDIAAVEVKRNAEGDWWTKNRGCGEGSTADGMRKMVGICTRDAIEYEAIARAIETWKPDMTPSSREKSARNIVMGWKR